MSETPPGIDFEETKRILAVLEREGVRYVLIGAMAMAAQGLVRATHDLDFFVSPDPENVDRLKRAFKSGEAFVYPDIESEILTTAEGTQISVATPRMLYRMKRDTVRPQDKLDAAVIKEEFKLEED